MIGQVIEFSKALSDPTRVRIIALLMEVESLCVCELFDVIGISQSTLSGHLAVIRDAGLVETTRSGKWVYYSMGPGKAELPSRMIDLLAREDPILAEDRMRLKQRLLLRTANCCVVGFEARRTR